MPVDPVVLHKYDPPTPQRARGPGDGLVAAAIAIGGTGFMLAVLPAALRDAGVARLFAGATVALDLAALGALIIVGWSEDGPIGVLYRLKHPLGTVLGGDDRPPWTWLASAWVVIAASVLSGVLIAKHPGAVPSWMRTRGPAGAPTTTGG